MDTIFDTKHLYRTYFKMALPVVLGLVVTLIYNLADTFFIAQTKDTALIAGVSVCSPVFTTLMAFGNIYGQGGSSLISRLLGQNNLEGTKRVSSFCFYIAIATGVVLAILMMAFCSPLLTLLGTDSDTFSHARNYYSVLAICAPIVVLSFIHSNLVRCEGLASQSMIGSALGTVINIILDPILISVFHMGSLGAAIATVIGYLCSDLYFLGLLHKKSHCLSTSFGYCKVSSEELKQILGVGITAALTNLMQSLTVIVLNQFLLSYGSDRIAAMGIVLKINMIVQLVMTGFAFGAVPLFGYLYGAKLHGELKKLIRFCMSFLTAIALILTIVLCVKSAFFMNIFVQDSELITLGSQMLRWQAISSVFVGIILICTVLFQATGKIIPSFLLSISRQGVVFLIVLLIFSALFGYNGILMAQAIADVLSAVLAMFLLYRIKLISSIA